MLRRYYAWRVRVACSLKGHPLAVLNLCVPPGSSWSCPCGRHSETFAEALQRVASS